MLMLDESGKVSEGFFFKWMNFVSWYLKYGEEGLLVVEH